MPTALVEGVDDNFVNHFVQDFHRQFFRGSVLSDTFQKFSEVVGFLFVVINQRLQRSSDLPHLILLFLVLHTSLIFHKCQKGCAYMLFSRPTYMRIQFII